MAHPKQPKTALEGSKWIVENHKSKQDLVVTVTEFKQTVFISNIEDSVVTVKGKCNAIIIQGAKRSGVVFDAIVANVEVINCLKVQLQANGNLPSLTIDKTTGATIYLQAEDSKKVDIITSLTSEINVVTPGKTANDDPKEQAIPQQFVSNLDAKGNLVTKPVEHVGV